MLFTSLPLIFQQTLTELAPSHKTGGLLQFQRADPSTAPDKRKIICYAVFNEIV
jgi:hypothetical protein